MPIRQVTISKKRIEKNTRRMREALKELDSLGPISNLIVFTPRTRNQAKHPNHDYEVSLHKAKMDTLPTGGFRSGSGQHYDREYRF